MEINPNPNFVHLNLYSREIFQEKNEDKVIHSLAKNLIFIPIPTGSPLLGRVSYSS
jgi:hypothetical protein